MAHSDRYSLVNDFLASSQRAADAELARIETAIFIEMDLGITLSDEEIEAENFGSPDALVRFVSMKGSD